MGGVPAGAPGGYGYSRWCELYRGWEGRLSPTMRQSHPAGERMFVDYAGQTVELYDARTGEIRAAQIFVAVMGASSYTYAEASWTQALPDWIGSHVRALAFMGGAPAQLVPDNPKVGVTRANWYEPGLNRTYLDLATHYRIAILPARPRRPRDKAKVEVGVLVVERWILARLRNRRFFSLSELIQAIAELFADLNARPMRRLGISRRDLFVELDTPPTLDSSDTNSVRSSLSSRLLCQRSRALPKTAATALRATPASRATSPAAGQDTGPSAGSRPR